MIAISTEAKAWGTVERLIAEPTFSLDRLRIKAGGHSSIHFHKGKLQTIFVVSGILKIRQFNLAGRLEREDDLESGELAFASMGIRHQFYALTDCVAYEVYQPADGISMDPNDIVRLSDGGCA